MPEFGSAVENSGHTNCSLLLQVTPKGQQSSAEEGDIKDHIKSI